VLISAQGMVQRTGVAPIRQTGRAAQGVKVMNIREDDLVSAVALVVESEADTDEPLGEIVAEEGPISIDATGGDAEAGPSIDDAADSGLDPSASLSEDAARASDPSRDGGGDVEPDEVDLDDVDGPPTPDA
jgi:DNA gyrase subunit A